MKFTLEEAMKFQKGRRQHYPFCNLSARCGWWLTPRPAVLTLRRSRYQFTAGRVGRRVGLEESRKSLPTGIQSPDHQANSESLYWLRYPSPINLIMLLVYMYLLSIATCFDRHAIIFRLCNLYKDWYHSLATYIIVSRLRSLTLPQSSRM